ncbi:hypothetical protein ASJ81_07190 [Methanosarcina spelaei]|uniref:Uncharacterized protein n=1 Tax=Methanosarcina spelaei TaxID=1036679 RepID=A0A2A2HSI0_9EURY|nr:hypothetical protein ASJ81_07190 [Methanosarcina spelaei]
MIYGNKETNNLSTYICCFFINNCSSNSGATSVPEGKVKPVDISEGLQMPLMSLAITLTLDKDRIL